MTALGLYLPGTSLLHRAPAGLKLALLVGAGVVSVFLSSPWQVLVGLGVVVVLYGVAGISLSVAGVGIMNVMLVSVTECTGEIGLLKAVGATRGQVLAAFLAEAAVLSSAGGILGLGSGLAAARLFRAVYPSFPAQPPSWAVAAALAVSASIGLLFGALPARRAARLDPIAALARRG